MMKMLKGSLKSKTIWVNVLTVLGGTLGYLAGHEVIIEHPDATAILVMAVGFVNVVLRYLTTESVADKA
jgi:uncharacterized membrane protein